MLTLYSSLTWIPDPRVKKKGRWIPDFGSRIQIRETVSSMDALF